MSDAVQQIKDRLNIIDVISPYVELHKAGKNFKGKSPFSAEKTPSFYVSPDRGMYYCFSTSQGGDIFSFIQAMEGVDFKESLKILAQKAGVELVPEDPKKKGERDRIIECVKAATDFYVSQLAKAPDAQSYLENRGVAAETIQTWHIGYAPGPPSAGWREVKDFLEQQNFTKEEILKAGLIKSADAGKEPYDVFRDRIMFPMADAGGKVVAFSGRLLGQNDKAPKYVNSPETELYKKSELLYGYDKAKHGIRTLDFSLIVEGQFDVVMSHQVGYNNAVAVSGTALTLQHVQLLERLSKRVVLALDADRAGIAAIKRAADVMLKRGLDVKVAEVPDGKDPADLVLAGKEKLKEVVGKSVHVIEFLLHVLKRNESDPRTLKLKVREEVLPFVLLLPNRIDQEHFVDTIATSINTTTDAIRFELDRLREENTVPSYEQSNVDPSEEKTIAGSSTVQKNYTFLLAVLDLVSAEHREKLQSYITDVSSQTDLSEPDTKSIAEATFILERQFEKLPPLAILEEVIAKLNSLRQGIAREHIADIRSSLSDAALEDQLEQLNIISKWETVLRANPYTVEDFETS